MIIEMKIDATAEEISAATRVIEAFEAALARGEGVVVVDGRLVEVLHINEAKAVLNFARILAGRS